MRDGLRALVIFLLCCSATGLAKDPSFRDALVHLQGIGPVGAEDRRLYVLGRALDDTLAVLFEDDGAESAIHTLRVNAINLRTDKETKLWEVQEEDEAAEAHPPGSSLTPKQIDAIAPILVKRGFVPVSAQVVPLPWIAEPEHYDVKVADQGKQHVVTFCSSRGEKEIARLPIRYQDQGEGQFPVSNVTAKAMALLPGGGRAAVILEVTTPGWEGPPSSVSFVVVGVHLTSGFPSPK